ncbi:MAG: N-methyl-D-aspartate receptor NMDAR2C subunit [Planctomycetota bacterium]|nr:N-methyl-D-aspartate receptor NMDAR2C subunit [Planctomycetota bacterium]
MQFNAHRWLSLLDRLSLTDDGETYSKLLAAHTESARVYHNHEHIADCLQQLDLLLAASESERVPFTDSAAPHEVEIAIWFHDAVYDPRAADNERRSADWAGSFLRDAGMAEEGIDRVEADIMATRHSDPPKDVAEQIIVDIDLSILGRAEDEYDRYEDRIRREYAFVPDAVFCGRRSEILQSFLDRSRIFTTPFFANRFETEARRNLKRSIQNLSR